MAQKTVEELERELKEAQQLENQTERQLADYIDKLAGKAFLVASSHPKTRYSGGWKHCSFVFYKDFAVAPHSGHIHHSGEQVSVSISDMNIWGFSYKKMHKSIIYDSFFPPQIEISLELFKAAVAYSKIASRSTMAFFRSIQDAGRLLDWQPDARKPKEEEIGLVLDIPFITLVNSEIPILGGTMFATVDDKYFITPTSVLLGLEILKKEEYELDRTSDLWQECDMGYVRGRVKTLKDLRAKLKRGKDVEE
jgi:hypothetical protein